MHPVPEWAIWFNLVMRATWLLSAAGTGVMMGRPGHDRITWIVFGLIVGPCAVISARRAARRPPRLPFAGVPGPGADEVLVLIDSERPADAAEQLGPAHALRRCHWRRPSR